MKKANKQEMEPRAGFAADLLVQGHSCTVVTPLVTVEHKQKTSPPNYIEGNGFDSSRL